MCGTPDARASAASVSINCRADASGMAARGAEVGTAWSGTANAASGRRTARPAARSAGERLRAVQVIEQMQVDIDKVGAAELRRDVRVPDLVEQRARRLIRTCRGGLPGGSRAIDLPLSRAPSPLQRRVTTASRYSLGTIRVSAPPRFMRAMSAWIVLRQRAPVPRRRAPRQRGSSVAVGPEDVQHVIG